MFCFHPFFNVAKSLFLCFRNLYFAWICIEIVSEVLEESHFFLEFTFLRILVQSIAWNGVNFFARFFFNVFKVLASLVQNYFCWVVEINTCGSIGQQIAKSIFGWVIHPLLDVNFWMKLSFFYIKQIVHFFWDGLLFKLLAKFFWLAWRPLWSFEETLKFVPVLPKFPLFPLEPNPLSSSCSLFLSSSLSLNWEDSLAWLWVELLTWSVKFFAGGQAKVLLGIVLGIVSEVMKGSDMISSNVGLLDGSRTNIFWIKFRALSEMVICSGKEYWHAFIFLYVAFTSGVSNGGFPISWV